MAEKKIKEQQKIHPWMISYCRQRLNGWRSVRAQGPRHIFLALCDHFEPLWAGADFEKGLTRVQAWHEQYPKIADRHRDADGCVPRYSFFFPIEEYRREYLDLLSDLCRRGYGEVEIHLHHDNDTPERLKKTLSDYKDLLVDTHGMLSRDKQSNEVKYAFIHGNWALDNSRPDGKWCGVDNELSVLQETGCYADFTMPSAPHITQTRKINSIYYAQGVPGRSKAHDDGFDLVAGVPNERGLLMIQGPLMLNWHKRKFGFVPGIENGLLDHNCRFSGARARLWVDAGVGLQNRPECIFIKLHAHGCQEDNVKSLLGQDLDALFSCFEKLYNDGKNYALHYVSAREMYNVIKALEAGEPGHPAAHRDYCLEKVAKGSRKKRN